MLNCKQLFYGALLLLVYSCKPAAYAFKPGGLVNTSLQKDPYFLATYDSKQKGISYTNITNYRIYRATIQEELVENNSVGEYKLINTKSGQAKVNKEINGNYHELYLYLFAIDSPATSKKFVLLSSGYNADGECISLGPAYTGSINTGAGNPSLNAEYAVKVKRCKKELYLQNKHTNKTDLDFLSHRAIMPDDHRDNLLQFYMVLQNKRNKIGGMNKPLIFNVAKVFNDSATLTFQLIAEKK